MTQVDFNEYSVRSGPSECRFTLNRHDQAVSLEDRSHLYNGRAYRSLTNGMDDVVAYLVEANLLRPGDQLVYCDTEGDWDRVLLCPRCLVEGFQHLGARELDYALALVEMDKRRVT